jgi:hypothetical protein
MQTKNDTSKPETELKEETGEGCPGATCSALRELMLALEYLRYACEHAEGRRKLDDKMLSRAMSVGIRINAKYAHLMDDHQKGTYWEEVWSLPARVGLPNTTMSGHMPPK